MNIDIFQPYTLAGVTLNNRILRSATHEGLADESGAPLPALTQKYLQLAKGGIGGIITGYAGIQPDGKSPLHRMLMIDRDELIPAYQSLVNALHAVHTPVFLQIAHCGRQTRSKHTGFPTVAPSALRDGFYSEDLPHALNEPEILTIIDNFVNAAVRAHKAGFDGVQLHAAHGYLLSSFLSPHTNRRTDAWGGNTENRFRIISEIYKRIQRLLPGYPVMIKLNATDGQKNGMRIPEAVTLARYLETAGCAAIEVSCGTGEDNFFTARNERNPIDAVLRYTFKFKSLPSPVKQLFRWFSGAILKPTQPTRLYNVPAALAIKQAVSLPVMVVGGIKSKGDIERILQSGQADMVSLCRPLILEPNLIEKFKQEKQSEAKCLACNYCMLGSEEESLRCYFGKLKTA